MTDLLCSSLQRAQPELPAPLKLKDAKQTLLAPAIGFTHTQAMSAYKGAFSLFTSQGFYRSLTLAMLNEFNRP